MEFVTASLLALLPSPNSTFRPVGRPHPCGLGIKQKE